MKVIVQTEFLCSYYYHAAKNSSEEIQKHKLSHSLYHAFTSLILWQCVFESYANFEIRRHKLEGFQITRKNRRSLTLEDASIKEKWIYLPIARNKPQFTLNKDPFKHFAHLVNLRNDLVHFNEESLAFEKEAPPTVQTIGELKDWIGTGDYLAGSIFETVLGYARAGNLIVRDMFQEYSRLTKDSLPDFLNGSEAVLKVLIKK
jgi:hypothetical protein